MCKCTLKGVIYLLFRFLKLYFFTTCLLIFVSYGVFAEDFSNTIDSVKVKSAGGNAVVVDVYINSKDANVKPQLSTRKYRDDKYVIDLMSVTQRGSVSKDTTRSEGLVKNNDIKVGTLPGGTARVLIDLDNPKLEIKEVKYHVVSEKPKVLDLPPSAPAKTSVAPTKKDKVVAVSVNKPRVNVPGTATNIAEKKKIAVVEPKSTYVPVPKSIQTAVKQNKVQDKKQDKPQPVKVNSVASPVNTDSNKIIAPVVIHKTDNPVKLASEPQKTNVAIPSNETKTIIIPGPGSNQSKTQPQVKAEPKPQPQVKAVPKPQPQVKVEPKPQPQVKAVPKPQSQVKAVLKPQSQVKAVPKPQPQVKVEPKPQPQVKIESKPQLQVVKHTNSTSIEPDKEVAANNNVVVQANPKPTPSNTNVVDTGKLPIKLPSDVDTTGVREVGEKGDTIDLFGLLSTLGFALIVVIPLIFITIFLIKMFSNSGDSLGLKALSSMGANKFKIISSTSLGQGRSIHLVEIKGRQLVIGCSGNSVNLLTEFDDFDEFVEEHKQPETINEVSKNNPKYKRGRPPLGSFVDLYKDYQKKIDEEDLEDEY